MILRAIIYPHPLFLSIRKIAKIGRPTAKPNIGNDSSSKKPPITLNLYTFVLLPVIQNKQTTIVSKKCIRLILTILFCSILLNLF